MLQVANTLDASTMFRRNNMSLRTLKMHLNKVGADFLKNSIKGLTNPKPLTPNS